MSVASSQQVEYEPWGGYDDPRLPTRVWKQADSILGDASGGQRSLTFEFVNSDVVRNAELYSLEEVYIIDAQNADTDLGMIATNFGLARGGRREVAYTLTVRGSDTGVAALSPQAIRAITGTFLGEQGLRSTAQQLTFQAANSNGNLFVVWCGGYVWGQRSLSAGNGGIMRPRDGVWSR